MAVIYTAERLGPFYMSEFGLWCHNVPFPGHTPVLGEEFMVYWDGNEYRVAAQDANAVMPGYAALGNASLFPGLQGNNEPFALGWSMEDGYMSVFSLLEDPGETEEIFHDFGISTVCEDAGSDTTGGATVSLKDRDGNPIDYPGVTAVQLATPDGGVQQFVAGEIVEKEVAPDFSDGDFAVAAGAGEFLSKVTVVKPVALAPENIAEDVNIAGVVGTMKASSGERPLEDKPIRFYDPDGNVIYAYTRKEVQELTELPPGPPLSGLTFERWTHTLDEVKSTMYFADIGPMYKYGANPATVLIVETANANTSITVRIGNVTGQKGAIYWGDGSSSTLSTSSSTGYSHSYASAGRYNIAIVFTAGTSTLGYQASNVTNSVLDHSINSAYSGNYQGGGTGDVVLRSVLIGSYDYYGYTTALYYAFLSYGLKFVSTYKANSRGANSHGFAGCTALKAIAGKDGLVYGTTASKVFNANVSLQRLNIYNYAGTDSFNGCDSLKEVMYTGANIKHPNMNVHHAMLLTQETPPTLGTSPVWGKKPIYVPDSAVATYKATNGWSNAANYILPASQYPD